MPPHLPTLVTIALVGFCSHANAQAPCPELTRLRSDAARAAKQATGVPTADRCETYSRLSTAWNELVRYASDHREQCNVSDASVSEFEQRHCEAVNARDNVCAGRPLRPFPPAIIRR